MGFRRISRRENLNVWSGIGSRGVVGEAAVVKQNVHVRY